MSGVDVVFWMLALTAVVSGWRVFRTQSMIRASFLLLLSFVSVGVIMLLLAASYIGIATIFMMGAEMMVMALFMVMFMMNPAGLNPMMMVHQHRFSIVAGAVAFVSLAAAVLLTDLPHNPVAASQPVIRDLGTELLGNSMLIFESAGVTLLAAMVGAVILSSRSGRFGPADEGSLPPSLSMGGKPAGEVPEENKGGHHGHGGMHAENGSSEDGSGHAVHNQAAHDNAVHDNAAHDHADHAPSHTLAIGGHTGHDA